VNPASVTVQSALLGRWPSLTALSASPTPSGSASVLLRVVDHAGATWTSTTDVEWGASSTEPWRRLAGPRGAVFAIRDVTPVHVVAELRHAATCAVPTTSSVQVARDEVAITHVTGEGFSGVLIRPQVNAPGIVALGGSEGGTLGALPTAIALANEGFAVLVVDYLGRGATSRSEVPLDPIVDAIRWLGVQEGIAGTAVGLWGASKGAEAALVVASLMPEAHAVVSVSGSPIVFEGLDRSRRVSSWTFQGRPLDFVRMRRGRVGLRMLWQRRRGVTLSSAYSRGPRCSVDNQAGAHLERLRCRAVLIAGEDDRFWPAAAMAEAAAGRCSQVRAVVLPDAGHVLPVPGIPPVVSVGCQPPLRTGGTLATNAVAQDQAWQQTLSAFATLRRRAVRAGSPGPSR
jgi:uncharacterized protein